MKIQNWYVRLAAGIALLAATGAVPAQMTAPAAVKGYLAAGSLDLVAIAPPAPVAGDARDAADRAIFRATRSADNTPRWTLAQHDADYSVAGLLTAFACALGVAPDSRNSPRLTALLSRASVYGTTASGGVKDRYHRRRPFTVDDGPICVARDDYLVNSFDYPSSHSTLGWMTGLILAQLEPDRATAILARARAYGESRIFCGVHNSSAVETGRIIAAAVVAALHGSPAFRKDLEGAGKDLAELRSRHPAQPASCAAEAQAISESPYSAHPAEAH